MNVLLLIAISFAQEPSVNAAESTPQVTESSEAKDIKNSEITSRLDAEIRGLPQNDAEVVQEMLNQEAVMTTEQRLLGASSSNSTQKSQVSS